MLLPILMAPAASLPTFRVGITAATFEPYYTYNNGTYGGLMIELAASIFNGMADLEFVPIPRSSNPSYLNGVQAL